MRWFDVADGNKCPSCGGYKRVEYDECYPCSLKTREQHSQEPVPVEAEDVEEGDEPWDEEEYGEDD